MSPSSGAESKNVSGRFGAEAEEAPCWGSKPNYSLVDVDLTDENDNSNVSRFKQQTSNNNVHDYGVKHR
jgi:hypothetical protein